MSMGDGPVFGDGVSERPPAGRREEIDVAPPIVDLARGVFGSSRGRALMALLIETYVKIPQFRPGEPIEVGVSRAAVAEFILTLEALTKEAPETNIGEENV